MTYALEFMGRGWDKVLPAKEIWAECLRVAKPGAMLLAFGGDRTHHRLMVNIEDAGWEIRTCIYWLFGSGFPKSHSIGKNIEKKKVGGIKNLKQIGTKKGIKVETGTQGFSYSKEYVAGKSMGGKQISGDVPIYEITNEWEGYGTALKPAVEIICLAMKPLDGNFAENAIKHGVAGLNIDECRVPGAYETRDRDTSGGASMFSTGAGGGAFMPTEGRFPANLILQHSPECIYIPNNKNNVFGKGMGGGLSDHSKGRFPANLILQHSPECVKIGIKKVRGIQTTNYGKHKTQPGASGTMNDGWDGDKIVQGYADKDGNETIEDWKCHPGCSIRILNEQSGNRKGWSDQKHNTFNPYGGNSLNSSNTKRDGFHKGYNDEGGASRFFLNLPPNPGFLYQPKASSAERNYGTEGVITWENVDLSQDLMELNELLKDISEDGLHKIKDSEWNMMLSGKNTMEQFQKDMMCTISMILKMIIELKILNYSQNLNIKDYILDVIKMITVNGLNLVKNVENINQLKQSITNEKMEYLLGAVLAVLKMLLKIKEKGKIGNVHSTVKPLKLLKYLCKLVAPPQNAIILDPFAGSGTLGVACEQLKIPYVLIEKESEYCDIIKARVSAANDPIQTSSIKTIQPRTSGLLDLSNIDLTLRKKENK